MHSAVNVLDDPGGLGTARWIRVRRDRRRTWSDITKKLVISSPLVSVESWYQVACVTRSDSVYTWAAGLTHRRLMGERIKLPKPVCQKLDPRSPYWLWLRNGLGAIEQLVDLTSKARSDDPQTKEGGGWSLVRAAGAGLGRRDIVILNRRRPAEPKRETFVEDVGDPKEELLMLGIVGGFALVCRDPMVAQ